MFSSDFVWGAATSAYQIEGAYNTDGKGQSIWDTFCAKEGMVLDGHTGNTACDHYHRFREDVAKMKEMGIQAYRFSLSWTRILPNGIGEVNENGVRFYQELLDELISNDIVPYITLFHWDYPQALHDMGGWMNPDSPEWFAEYAKVVAKYFSDKCKYFITLNEPQCFIGKGYLTGTMAPGYRFNTADTIIMAHNVLKAHGRAVQELRKHAVRDIQIGYAPTCGFAYPNDEKNQADIEMARKVNFRMGSDNQGEWTWNIAWWSDPVILGSYPKDGRKLYEKYLPEGWREDLALMNQPLDFYCQNIYNGYPVKALPDGYYERVKSTEESPSTANGWPITPKAMKWCVKYLCERYKLPIYITENGLACADVVSLDGQVHDPNRIDFLHRYLKELREAAEEGAKVAGYFQWSLLDNFEWAFGYKHRFGLIYVNYATQERTMKDSGYWYKTVIEANGNNL